MKKLVSLLLALTLLLSFSACSLLGGSEGDIYVISDGERYAAVVNDISENGIYDAKDFKEKVTQIIPYGPGFSLSVDGNHTGDITYSLYDGEGNEFYSDKDVLEIPVAVGTYYCIVKVNWGDEVHSKPYQHCFCFARSE